VETECSVVLDSAAGSPVEDLESDLSDLIDFLCMGSGTAT
jgi:hypothetical protein